MSSLRVHSALQIDADREAARIAQALREHLGGSLKRRGLVVGMSSGIDSSVCAALAVRALGARHVVGLFMPERDSDPESLRLARELAQQLGIEGIVEDVGAILEAAGCYERRDDAIRRVVPEYDIGWRCKLALQAGVDGDRINVTYLVVASPDGATQRVRIPAAEYRQIVAATNFKQRTRKMMEYYHADRLHYAVVGTPNRLEYDQGFFVKGGDGLADVKPIAHLYKSQVYQLADHLGIPSEISSRPPTTDTFSLPQSQEEFYYTLPIATLDLVLHGHETGRPLADVARDARMTVEQVERAVRDIVQKRATTRYLHLRPLLVEESPVIAGTGTRD